MNLKHKIWKIDNTTFKDIETFLITNFAKPNRAFFVNSRTDLNNILDDFTREEFIVSKKIFSCFMFITPFVEPNCIELLYDQEETTL